METEVLVALITGSISLIGVVFTAWFNYKAKLVELQIKNDKQVPGKKMSGIWLIIFAVILIGSAIYFFTGTGFFEWDKQHHFEGKVRFETLEGEPMPAQFTKIRDIGVVEIGKKGNFKLKEIYPKGTQFRMYIKSNEDAYLYALAANSQNQVNILYPYNKNIDAFFEKNDGEIAIPGATHALEISGDAGTDLFCLLYAKEQIDIYALKYELEQAGGGGFTQKLHHALSNQLVAPNEIDFKAKEIAFSAKSGETILPVIIAINHK